MKNKLRYYVGRALALLAVIATTAPYALCAQLVISSDPSDIFYSIGHTDSGGVRFAGERGGSAGFFDLTGNTMSFTALSALSSGGYASAYRISSDGTRIVGYSESPNTSFGFEATLWNVGSPNSPVGLGFAGGSLPQSSAVGIATVGSSTFVVGQSSSPIGSSAVRWTVGGTTDLLPRTGLPTLSSFATGITADGSKWSGNEDLNGLNTVRAVYGDSTGAHALDTLGNPSSGAGNISRDGSVIVGGIGQQAAFWSGSGYTPTLITLDGAPLLGTALAADGGFVVGMSYDGFGWIAGSDGTAHRINDWLNVQYGLNVEHKITSINDIYINGDKIELAMQGSGIFFSGSITSVPEPATIGITGLGLLCFALCRISKRFKKA